ncbi:MAG TPA: hypothetical protein VD866_04875 [Urbifossiella sp.]|nr:hypothetical protein [Urbifossiella sp.]
MRFPFFNAPSTRWPDFDKVAGGDAAAEARFLAVYSLAVRLWVDECVRAGSIEYHAGEDLKQTIICALHKHVSSGDAKARRGRVRFRATAHTIARNRLIDHVRREAKDGRVKSLTEADFVTFGRRLGSADESFKLLSLVCVERVRERHLADGPGRSWAVFEAHVMDGTGYAEIAATFDITVDNARQIVRRVRAEIRAERDRELSPTTPTE